MHTALIVVAIVFATILLAGAAIGIHASWRRRPKKQNVEDQAQAHFDQVMSTQRPTEESLYLGADASTPHPTPFAFIKRYENTIH